MQKNSNMSGTEGRSVTALRAVLLTTAVIAALGAAACGGDDGSGSEAVAGPSTIPQPSEEQLVAAGLDKLPLAPESKRLDITAPTFSSYVASMLSSAEVTCRRLYAGNLRLGSPE